VSRDQVALGAESLITAPHQVVLGPAFPFLDLPDQVATAEDDLAESTLR
jgi:hypothetical protein